MKLYFSSLILLFGFVGVLEAQLSTPAAGFVRYPGMPVEAVYGIAGNLIAGPAVWGVADGLSFGKDGGLVAGEGHILLVRADGSNAADYTALENRPVLNIGDTLDSAVAWLPTSGTILFVDSRNRFSTVVLGRSALGGVVSSVSRISAQTVRLLVTQADRSVAAVKVSVPGGEVESSDVLPGVRGPAYEIGERFIWGDERGLEIGTLAGAVQTLAAPAAGPFSAERMSAGWVHLTFAGGGGSYWALNFSGPSASLFRLPASRSGQ